LEDFIKINKWFNIFYNIENLLSEFEILVKSENFVIEQKNRNVLSLFIVFPIDLLERIEIQLPINEINNLDLFSQLISKINEIESKENNDIAFFDEKIDNLSHLLQSIEEVNKAKEEEMIQNQNQEQNKENNEEEKENNNEEKNNNLEEMKDALKLQIEKKIKNDNIQQDDNNEINNANINNNIEKEEENEKGEENINEQNEQNIGFISPVENNNLLFAESSIISLSELEKRKELNLLQNWLDSWINKGTHDQPSIPYSTKLIFSSEKEDDKASSFHKNCDNIAPTLVLIETKEGFRYGGFTTQKWESPEQSIFKNDEDAFIFSIDTEKKYDVTDPKKSIQCSMFWGPYFGEGGAICVPDNFLHEKNAFYQWPSSYDISEKDELTFGQEHKINISKYEVYQIIIENNAHDSDDGHELEELQPRQYEEE